MQGTVTKQMLSHLDLHRQGCLCVSHNTGYCNIYADFTQHSSAYGEEHTCSSMCS